MTFLTQYLVKRWTHFYQTSSIDAFWGQDECFRFWAQKVRKFKVTVGSACWKVHFLALLTQYLENYSTEVHQTFSVDALWDKGERFSFWGQGHRPRAHQAEVHRARNCESGYNFARTSLALSYPLS